MTPELEETITELYKTNFILVIVDDTPTCYSNIPLNDTIRTLTHLLTGLHKAAGTASNPNTNN